MSPISINTFSFRHFCIYALIALVVLAFIAYVLFQARLLLEGPRIELTQKARVQEERLVTIEGKAQNIVHMTLNGRQIFTDSSGNFKEALVLENGYTIATLRAEDRYGRVTSEIQDFVFLPGDGIN